MRLRLPTVIASAALAGPLLGGCAGGTAPQAAPTEQTTTSAAAPISPRISAPRATDAMDGWPLGQRVPIGVSDHTVSVDAVDLDGAAAVAGVAPGATAPEGRMVLVTLSAALVEDTTTPTSLVFSVVVGLSGGGETYSSCTDAGDLRDGALVPPAPGQRVTYQECSDVAPTAAVPTSLITVTDVSTGQPTATDEWSID